VFTTLASPTLDPGHGTISLWGEIRAGIQIPTGSVAITLGGVTESAPIHAVTGDFSASFSTAALGTAGSPSTITYTYAGSGGFTAVSGTGALTVAAVPPGVAGQTTYHSILGDVLTMNIWQGTHVSLLTPTAMTGLDPTVIARILATADNAYEYYASALGAVPNPYPPNYYINGRDSIAVVDHTGGAGYSYLGATGIELMTPYFNILYNGVANNNQYDQVLFYELGRNFWLIGDQLNGTSIGQESFTTGFAVLMRFLSLDSTGEAGGPYNSWSYAEFEQNVKNLVDEYVADPALDFANTLATGQGVPDSQLGSTDLFASFLLRLGLDYGGDSFFQSLWKQAAALPSAPTDQSAIDNLFLAACAAAGRNLTGQFVDTWRWPISQAAQAQAAAFPGSSPPLTPAIAWSPAPITYGTPLGAAQLDATASLAGTAVAGTFTYSPSAGTILGAGLQTLSVAFTPTDTADYTPTTATAQINVLAAPLVVAVNPAARRYGQANPAFTVSFSGLVPGQDPGVLSGALAFNTAAQPAGQVGTYAVTVSGLSSANYTITYVPGVLRVDPAVLTVTAVDIVKPLNAPNPRLKFTESGLVLGQAARTVVKGAPVLSTSATRKSPAGLYPILIRRGTLRLVSRNYTFELVNGVLQVAGQR
jgi:hypothetical protein